MTIGGAPLSGVDVVSTSTITGTTSAATALPAPTVSAISPTSGGTSGGTTVTITGSNFADQADVVVSCSTSGSGTLSGGFTYDAVTGVSIGGTPASFTATASNESPTSITISSPPGIPGVADVIVTTPFGTSGSSGNNLYAYTPGGASISAIGPTFGLTSGGNQITITGTNFVPGAYANGAPATTATIGGQPVTNVSVTSTTSLTGLAPAGAVGAADVRVTTPAGTTDGGFIYLYEAASTPSVSSVSPDGTTITKGGTVAGGTPVTISGNNFTGATSVMFGTTPVGSFSVTGPGTITTTTPAHAVGTVDVVVTVTSGANTYTSATSSNDQFTYVTPPPVVNSIGPSTGSTSGGTSVTITGQYFTGASCPSAVTIGGTPVTSCTVVNDSQITAVTGSHSAGSVSVSVTTPTNNGSGGTGTSATPLYTYATPTQPTVSTISPSSGSTAGGNIVTISGSGFTGATSVTFGGTAGTHLTVITDGEINVTAPAGSAGAATVVVTAPGGTASTTYTYVTPAPVLPTVTSISPNQGTTLGGTNVTITGTNFSGTPQVTIGGNAAAEVTVVNATTITAVTPAGTGNNVPVIVTTSFGPSVAANIYSYVAPTNPTPPVPTISSVSPNSGTTLGLTPVTITGTNFTGATGVTFGNTPATNVVVVNATTITVLAPPGTGVVSVTVTTPGGPVTDPGAYTYVTVPPTVTAVNPNSGTTLGGTSVNITGTNFTGATAVTFGSNAATSFTVLNATTITATTPAGTGTVNVSVTTPAGTGTGTNLFTYVTQSPPTVTAITPNGGSIANGGSTAGGAAVTITGTNFTGATSVTIGNNPATFVVVVNPTTITAVTPAHAVGTVNVSVTTPAGTGTSATPLFTYVEPAPTVTGITPNSGPVAGGTPITITGTNFTGATSVTIGGNTPTSVTFVSPTEITAVTPAGTAGPATVTVTTPAGPSTGGTNLFTYVAPPVSGPTVTSISPSSGTTGTPVTITGTGFTSPASVSFGGVPATNVTVLSPTEIVADAPSSSGTVNVTVTTGAGTSPAVAGDQFTYTSKTTPTLTLTSSPNPSTYGQLVTFTAKVTGNSPTGTVTFSKNGVQLGTATLTNITATSATATFTTAALPVGSDPVTASYGGDANNLPDPTTVVQVVGISADSVKLHQFQLAVMPVEANTSAQAISGAIDNAIDAGFSGSCPDIPTPNGSGFTYCFDGTPRNNTPPAQQARARVDSDFASLNYANAAPGTLSSMPQNTSAPQNILAANLPPAYPTKPAAAAPYAPPREWLAWVDVRGTDFEQNSPGNDLKGLQGNVMFGLTRRFGSDFLFGLTTGYENFNFSSLAYNGKLGGQGATAGAYAGLIFGRWRLEAAGTWSDVFVSGSSGTAAGNFTATRWLGFGGLTGNFGWMGTVFEPTAQVFTMWEHDNAYTDSLGTAQPTNEFDTGRASGGLKISHALPASDVNLVPYVGFFADYYFTMDSADATTPGVAAAPLLQGWAGRATGGLTATFSGGAQVSAGAEYGGIGNNFQIWTVTLRGSVPF